MNVRRGVVIGSAVFALVGLMSSPRLLFGSDQSPREGNHPADLRPMPSAGGSAGFAIQSEGARPYLGRQQVSAALVDPVADG